MIVLGSIVISKVADRVLDRPPGAFDSPASRRAVCRYNAIQIDKLVAHWEHDNWITPADESVSILFDSQGRIVQAQPDHILVAKSPEDSLQPGSESMARRARDHRIFRCPVVRQEFGAEHRYVWLQGPAYKGLLHDERRRGVLCLADHGGD